MGEDLDSLFIDTAPESLSYVYQMLGCYHSLLPSEKSPHKPPSVPALLTSGFLRWQLVQILICPQIHATCLRRAVKKFTIIDPVTGKPFPKDMPDYVLPSKPDERMTIWHMSQLAKMEEEAMKEKEEEEEEEEKESEQETASPSSSFTSSSASSSMPSSGTSTRRTSTAASDAEREFKPANAGSSPEWDQGYAFPQGHAGTKPSAHRSYTDTGYQGDRRARGMDPNYQDRAGRGRRESYPRQRRRSSPPPKYSTADGPFTSTPEEYARTFGFNLHGEAFENEPDRLGRSAAYPYGVSRGYVEAWPGREYLPRTQNMNIPRASCSPRQQQQQSYFMGPHTPPYTPEELSRASYYDQRQHKIYINSDCLRATYGVPLPPPMYIRRPPTPAEIRAQNFEQSRPNKAYPTASPPSFLEDFDFPRRSARSKSYSHASSKSSSAASLTSSKTPFSSFKDYCAQTTVSAKEKVTRSAQKIRRTRNGSPHPKIINNMFDEYEDGGAHVMDIEVEERKVREMPLVRSRRASYVAVSGRGDRSRTKGTKWVDRTMKWALA